MPFTSYDWPIVDRFVGRRTERTRLDDWWRDTERMPVAVRGRRHVGKSWLLRRFAHGKPAVLLAAERLVPGAQLSRFAEQLTPFAGGVTPDLPNVASLIRTLYRVAAQEPLLAVIDEFPWVLGTGPSPPDAVCDQLLQPDAPLWNEGRTIVGQELREPAVHFAILEQLADGDKELVEITGPLRLPGATVSRYRASLESLRLVHRRFPFGASPTARAGHWSLRDPFLRFWFRFVFPFQADLVAGLAPADLYGREIEPALARPLLPGELPRPRPGRSRSGRHPDRELVAPRPQRPAPNRAAQHRGNRHRRDGATPDHHRRGGPVDHPAAT